MAENTLPGTRLDQTPPCPAAAADPVALVKREYRKALVRRFYRQARAERRDGAFVLVLDERVAKSPGEQPSVFPSLAAAEAIAEEWSMQAEWIDPASMPMTRIANSAIDGVARNLDAAVEEIAKYAGADLVCCRAAEPRTLSEAQAAAWDPILVFAREKLGAHFICTEGMMFIEQPEPARAAVTDVLKRYAETGAAAPFALAALHVMTTLTGSVLLALAVADGAHTPAEAWTAAHVDEDFEMQAWAEDAEALLRREGQWREFAAAARLFKTVCTEENRQ